MAVKITIIGWYGTETIGDRAILLGIFSFLKKAFKDVEIMLGSLYPFFTQRTLSEDACFWKEILGEHLSVQIFNSKKVQELNQAIIASDFVIMGGGPLMHIGPLFMIEYAFRKAKLLKKKTVILGCGIGPMFKKQFKKSLVNIIEASDLIIFRDSLSKKYLEEIYIECEKDLKKNIYCSLDPAIQCILDFNLIYKKDIQDKENNNIALNLRSFPANEYIRNGNRNGNEEKINKQLYSFVDTVATVFSGYKLLLVPMHYFCIGNDDRELLNKIRFELNRENILVCNKPLSLQETLYLYGKADFNIGMRFHSVVFQTMVSGKNFILDYTEPKKGKIFSFIHDIDMFNFYHNRYINLQSEKIPIEKISLGMLEGRFLPDKENISRKMQLYVNLLNDLF